MKRISAGFLNHGCSFFFIEEVDDANRLFNVGIYFLMVFGEHVLAIRADKKGFCVFDIAFGLVFCIGKGANPYPHIFIFMEFLIMFMVVIEAFLNTMTLFMYSEITVELLG